VFRRRTTREVPPGADDRNATGSDRAGVDTGAIAFAGGGADWLRSRPRPLDDALSLRGRKRIARIGRRAGRLTESLAGAGLKGLSWSG
jgi:hypothetical protein